MGLTITILTFVVGLAVLTGGAHWFVHGAVRLAKVLRVSQLMIGLTVVAFGTSAPELFLDVTATARGAVDLAFGDLVGSNIANIGLILGVAAVSRPLVLQMRLLRVELPLVIGLTIVAIGTSLPELATSVTATIRRQADISVGNVLGSNVFNILFVMGLCAQIKPLPVRPESLQFDLPDMLGSVVLVGVLVMRGQRLGRVGGALLLIGYGTYLWNKAV